MKEEVKSIKWEDVKGKLVGLVPLTNDSSWKFTPSIYDDIPEEFRPTFYIKQFTMESGDKIRKILADNMDKKKKNTDTDDAEIVNELYKHFEKWENLYNLGTGEILVYDGTREMFNLLPKNIIMKIFEEALVLGGIIPKQLKDLM